MNFNQNLLTNFFGYGILIFPLFLLIGPLVSEIFLILIIFFSTYYIFKERKFNFFNNKYLVFFLIFYLSTLTSTLLNFYNYDYVKSGILYFRIPLFSLAIWFVLENSSLFNKKVIILYSTFLIIIISDSLFQFFTGENFLGYEILRFRISSFFGDELILGSFLVRILPIFLICTILSNTMNEKKINIFFAFLISLVCVIVYLSGERTSFFLLILFFGIIFLSNKFLRKFIIVVMIFTVCFSFVISKNRYSDDVNPAIRMFKKSYEQIIGKGEERYEKHKKKLLGKVYIFSHDHHGHYTLSYRIFKDHPIMGTGPKGFRYLCRNKIYILENNDGCSTHPHNTYIQILTSNGIIGFTLLLFSFLYISKEIFIIRKKINSQKIFDKFIASENIVLAAIFINLWPLIPSGNFFNNWLSMIYFYPIGFYLYLKYRNENLTN
jgi:hypothetical protein